jgi:hypothetical protein
VLSATRAFWQRISIIQDHWIRSIQGVGQDFLRPEKFDSIVKKIGAVFCGHFPFEMNEQDFPIETRSWKAASIQKPFIMLLIETASDVH